MGIKLTWLGHACFIVEKDGYKILVDPYQADYVYGLHLEKQNVNEVICSHEHTDHGDRSMAVLENGKKSPFDITVIDSYHDDKNGKLRGKNKIHIFEADGIRVAHMGDIGCELNAEQEALLKNVEAILIPTGGTYTLDAKQADALVRRLVPMAVIPMHYRTESFGFPVLQHIDEFTGLRDDVVYTDSNCIEIAENMPKGTVVLQYKG